MKAGTLRHRVTIQQRTDTQNDAGEAVTSWSDWQNWWACIRSMTGREFMQSQQPQAVNTAAIDIRYCRGLTVRHRIKYTDNTAATTRIFDINSIQDADERKAMQTLFCSEVK